MTMKASCVLCTVVVWVLLEGGVRAAPAPAGRQQQQQQQPQQQRIPEDDVNVLMYGVLQFSDSMRSTFQSTEAKLGRLLAAVHKTEGLVRQLDQQTLEAKQAEAQIKQGIQHLQTQTANLKSTTEEAKGKVQEVQQEDLELKTKLKALESTLNMADPDNVKLLKETVERNSRLLRDLLDWTQHQKMTLQTQSQQLSNLQKQGKS